MIDLVDLRKIGFERGYKRGQERSQNARSGFDLEDRTNSHCLIFRCGVVQCRSV